MKALKKITVFILILILVFAIAGLIVPGEFHYAATSSIKAPIGMVYKQVSYFENINAWSPWAAYDPDMKTSIEGEDGQVGVISSWEGNDEVGAGTQEITGLMENERVDVKINFIKPWEAENTGYYLLEEAGDSVRVTWGFEGVMEFPGNVFGLFMNMEESIGEDFKTGLANLKARCEKLASENKTYRGYEIKEIDIAKSSYLALRDTVNFEEMQEFFSKGYASAAAKIAEAGMQPISPPTGLYFIWDMENSRSYMAAGFKIEEGAMLETDGELELINIDNSKALLIEYYGAYEQSINAHYGMDDYIKEKGYSQKEPVIEEYITGPQTETDTAKWVTRIIYSVEE